MKFSDLHECLEPLGMTDLAEALLQCGLVEAVQGFKVMRTSERTYVVLPILQDQLTPGRDCRPLPSSNRYAKATGLDATPVEKQVPLGTQLPSSRQKERGKPTLDCLMNHPDDICDICWDWRDRCHCSH